MRLWIYSAAVLAVLPVPGCARSCTEVGADSVISVIVDDAVEAFPGSRVGACVDQRCLHLGQEDDDSEIQQRINFDMGSNARSGRYTIVVTVNGEAISNRTFDLEASKPNGERCPPSVLNASFFYDSVTGIGRAQSYDN